MKDSEKKIFDKYIEFKIGKSGKCLECKKETSGLWEPASIWQVGGEYEKSKYKVLFVGKAARGKIDGEPYSDFVDSTNRADELYEFRNRWAYWGYTKAIANELYKNNDWKYAWERIAFTNMVKCNSSETVDTTTELRKNNCLHILKEEIKLLTPKNIVFYTHGYDDQIKALFDNILSSESNTVKIGSKEINIWTFTGVLAGNAIRVIRPGHPERKKKIPFVEYVVNFIKNEVE